MAQLADYQSFIFTGKKQLFYSEKKMVSKACAFSLMPFCRL